MVSKHGIGDAPSVWSAQPPLPRQDFLADLQTQSACRLREVVDMDST